MVPQQERRQRRRPARLFVALIGAVAATFASVQLFAAAPAISRNHKLRSSSSVRLNAEADVANDMSGARDAAKLALLDLLDDEDLAKEVLLPEGKPMRGRLDELIVQLERFNPNDEPAYSEQLDGKWTVKYSGSYAPGFLSSPTRELALFLYGGGFSLGAALSSFADGFWGQSAGFKVLGKKVEIIDGRDIDAEAEVELPGGKKEILRYKAELMPLSSRRVSEEVVSFELPAPLGTQDAPLEIRRGILVTYLDESMMVVRDESGVPEVLTREIAPVEPLGDEGITESVMTTEDKNTTATAAVPAEPVVNSSSSSTATDASPLP